jgi:hypothetical protein
MGSRPHRTTRFATATALAVVLAMVCTAADAGLDENALLCACGHHITSAEHAFHVASPAARQLRNVSLGSGNEQRAPVQRFMNPHALSFDVVTFSDANVGARGHRVLQVTWFAGFSWQVCG